MIAPSDGKLYAGWFMHTRKIAQIDPASRSYSLLPQSLKQVESSPKAATGWFPACTRAECSNRGI